MTNNRKNYDENTKKENTRFIEETDANHENDTRNDIRSPEKKSSGVMAIVIATIASTIAVAVGMFVLFASNNNTWGLLSPPSSTISQDASPLARQATETPKQDATLAPQPTEAPTSPPTESPTSVPIVEPTDIFTRKDAAAQITAPIM